VARFVTTGIFRPVYLEYREGLEIEDVYVRTDAVDRFGASIVAEYTLSGFDKPGSVEKKCVSPPKNLGGVTSGS
jgi:beta-galactosidase/beta-glucuronidase